MRTLHVTDLDGTLLRSDATLSPTTIEVINGLVADGLSLSYATARSFISAARVTRGLDLRLPVAVSGGAFVVDPVSGDVAHGHYLFADDVAAAVALCAEHGVPPLVYDGSPTAERVSWVGGEESVGIRSYLADRPGDPRLRPVPRWSDLPARDVFYLTVIGAAEPLAELATAIAEATGGRLTLTAQVDTYHPSDTYLELTAREASKAGAVGWLRDELAAERVVVFGDNLNDLPMFGVADEAYAVAGAVPEVAAAATGVIGAQGDDAVARWLAERVADGRSIVAD